MANTTPTSPSIGSLVKDLFKDLIRSKKFAALFAGIVANLAVLGSSKFGISEEMATDVATKVTGLVATYVLGQGIADAGKEKSRVEAVKSEVIEKAPSI